MAHLTLQQAQQLSVGHCPPAVSRGSQHPRKGCQPLLQLAAAAHPSQCMSPKRAAARPALPLSVPPAGVRRCLLTLVNVHMR